MQGHGEGPDAALEARLRRIRLTAGCWAAAWIVATVAATLFFSQRSLSSYLAEAAAGADSDAKAISGVVDRQFHELAAMPSVLANSAELRAIAKRYSARGKAFAELSPDERARQLLNDAEVTRLSARLTAIRNELNYDLISLLDAEGIRIVSSEWDQPLALLGERLDDREYFKQAIAGRAGHQFAVARTTRNPVLFFSAPIADESGPVGGVIVRQDGDHLESLLAGGRHLTMIVDRSGMVVAASRPELALSHVGELASSRPDDVTLGELYAQDQLRTLGIARPPRPLHEAEWLFDGQRYLISSAGLMNTQYRLLVFTPIDHVAVVRPLHYAIGMMAAIFGVLAALYAGRRSAARERQRHAAQITAVLNQKLVALNKDKDRYLGIAAHDLRNPLSSLRGLAELMLDTPLDPEQRTEFLDTIRRTSDEMLHLVNDLLDTAVIESGELTLKRTEQDVTKLVSRRVRHLELHARNKRITLSVEACEGRAFVDAARFSQVIDNLVSNAIKFSPSGTTVHIAQRFDDGHFGFSVQDQGPGIPAAERALLFRSFQKLSAQPTGGETSTGLGLAIVKKIVDAHGGSIDVADAPGGGTRFTVTVPAAVPGG